MSLVPVEYLPYQGQAKPSPLSLRRKEWPEQLRRHLFRNRIPIIGYLNYRVFIILNRQNLYSPSLSASNIENQCFSE